MPFCSTCGNSVPEGAAYCATCGTKLANAASLSSPAPSITPVQAPAPAAIRDTPPQRSLAGSIIRVMIGVVAVIAAIAIVVSWIGSEESDSSGSALEASGETGLLGAPLPAGATLVESREGDPAAGVDAAESYSITASADEIAAYFEQALADAGWTKTPPSNATVLFFERGDAALGVLIDAGGGSFTLQGS